MSIKNLLAIPVYNEERYLRSVLAQARRYIDDILVIDDGSSDSTPNLLAIQDIAAVLTHPENRGYGASLASAFAYAVEKQYDWLITMDCDEQHEPALIPEFLAAAESDTTDVVSGSRYLETCGDDDLPPADRRHINTRITAMLNKRLGLGITDAFCGFKAYRVATIPRFCVTVPGYAMPMQWWVQVWRAGLRVSEIPVRLIYNDPTRHFGGSLDDPDSRYRHYLDVFNSEMTADACAPSRRTGCDLPAA